jgi:hypothetical protein
MDSFSGNVPFVEKSTRTWPSSSGALEVDMFAGRRRVCWEGICYSRYGRSIVFIVREWVA